VELAAIIVRGTIGEGDIVPTQCRNNGLSLPITEWELLGASVLQRMTECIKQHVPLVSVAHCASAPVEEIAFKYAQNGVKHLLMVQLRNYVELDVLDLQRFHTARPTPLTEVVSRQEMLGMRLIEAESLIKRGTLSACRPSASGFGSSSYQFSGYRHALDTPADFRRLTRIALANGCGIKPYGTEVQPGVWVAHGAKVVSSARLVAPCYVGSNARIGHGVLVANGSSIEQECKAGCGSFIDDSTLLPNTYVGAGLDVSQSIVAGGRLLHLGRELEIILSGTGLAGYTHKTAPAWNTPVGTRGVRDSGQSTPVLPLASLNRIYSWFAE